MLLNCIFSWRHQNSISSNRSGYVKIFDGNSLENIIESFLYYTLGVPATSRILTGDSQKLSFSILRKVPFLIFCSDKPPRRTNSAHSACSRAGTWATWADVVRRRDVSCVDKIYIFETLMKNCSKYSSPRKIRWNFFKSGHPYFLVNPNVN